MSFFRRASSAAKFVPHAFRNRPEYLDRRLPLENPKVFITPLALDKMYHYVDIGSKEVGWLGTAFQQGSNFVIEDVFLLKQQVHATTTEITPSGLGDFAMDIIQSKPENEAERIINNLRFWGHSHVNMGTSPSGQDEHQMELFRQRGNPWFVRAILNKMGRIEITVFDYRRGIKFVDAEWAVLHTPDMLIREAIENEFHEKVREMGFWGSSGTDYLRPYQTVTRDEPLSNAAPSEVRQQEAPALPNGVSIDEPAGDGPPADLAGTRSRAPEGQRATGNGQEAKPETAKAGPGAKLGERLAKVLAGTTAPEEAQTDSKATTEGNVPEAIIEKPRKRRWYFLWLC